MCHLSIKEFNVKKMQNKRQALQSKIEFLLSQLTHSYPPLCDDYSKNNKNEHLAQQNLDLRFQLLKLQQLLLKSDNQELLNKCDQEWMTILMNFNEMKNAFPTLRHVQRSPRNVIRQHDK